MTYVDLKPPVEVLALIDAVEIVHAYFRNERYGGSFDQVLAAFARFDFGDADADQ